MEFSDGLLVKESMDGSVAAFEQLVARYEKLVYKIAFGCCGNRENALDIVQNVFLKVHRKLADFRTEGDFRNWIARIAVNESIDWKRASKRRRTVELDEAINLALPPSQEVRVRDRETWEMLNLAMQTLKPQYRAAVALRYFEGMSIREIAGALSCSDGTVKSILFRSLKQMRDHIGVSKGTIA